MIDMEYMYENQHPPEYYADDFFYEICDYCRQAFDPEWEEIERGTDDKSLLFCCGRCRKEYDKQQQEEQIMTKQGGITSKSKNQEC